MLYSWGVAPLLLYSVPCLQSSHCRPKTYKMKLFVNLLPLAALGTAFVLPPEQVLAEIEIEDHHPTKINKLIGEVTSAKDEVLSGFKKHFGELTEKSKNVWEDVSSTAKNALDEAFDRAEDAANSFSDEIGEATGGLESWFEGHDGDHQGRPDKRPHKPPHHHKPNLTVYQMIAGSKYTTTLAKLISEYDDLVEALNSTKANYTLFAPTDKAFEKIPEKAPKPSKEQLKAILSYHVVPDVFPAGRVLTTHTVPTLLLDEHLSSEPVPQRLVFKLGLRGLTVNFYSRILPQALNIFATNGVIHGVDSIIIPPPKAITLVNLFPGEFSTLELGLTKTGLQDKLNTTDHPGGTLFAPSNFAFKKLGPKINAFLFSTYGEKYLKALLEYHVVPGTTLYSDAIYQAKEEDLKATQELPKRGHFHIDLPTLLKERNLSVDIARFAGFITMKINAFTSVAVQDGIAQDGVIQV